MVKLLEIIIAQVSCYQSDVLCDNLQSFTNLVMCLATSKHLATSKPCVCDCQFNCERNHGLILGRTDSVNCIFC